MWPLCLLFFNPHDHHRLILLSGFVNFEQPSAVRADNFISNTNGTQIILRNCNNEFIKYLSTHVQGTHANSSFQFDLSDWMSA